MVTVVTEGIFSYCGVKVKIGHRPLSSAPRRRRSGPRARRSAHVTTSEYRLADAVAGAAFHHLTGGSKKEGRVTLRQPLMDLSNCKPVELTIDGGAYRVWCRPAIRPSSTASPRAHAVGCGSATIGMFAKQASGKSTRWC